MIYLIGTNIRKGCPPFCTPFSRPPFAPPFIFIPLEWKNQNFPLFRGRTQYSWVPRWRCPPFLPPLFEFLESPKHDLQILYVSSFVKMCCFCSTDPCLKNESAILLCFVPMRDFGSLDFFKGFKDGASRSNH